jgi:3-oxoacyl-[acyl-carrier protein] reductase
MSLPLHGRVAVITGAGAGMGRAHAEILAERGAHVIVLDVREAKVAEVVAGIKNAGAMAEDLACDVSDVPRLQAELRAAERRCGRIDILVNNAGISGRATPVEQIDEDYFDRMFRVHVKAAFFAGQALIPGMKSRRYGKIVNVASVFAMKGSPSASHYTAAKGAMLGLTKAWALELAPFGICVNAVAPSLLKTEMTIASVGEDFIDSRVASVPMGRLALPRDIAQTVAFLASPESDFMTGQTLSPNGGDTIVGF